MLGDVDECRAAYERLLVSPNALQLSGTLLGSGQFGIVGLGTFAAPPHHPGWALLHATPSRHRRLAVAIKTVRVLGAGTAGGARAVDLAAGEEGGEAGTTSHAQLTQILLEARLLAVLAHPHLVRLVAVSAAHQPILLAMEYCRHGSLNTFLRGKPPCMRDDYAAACTDMGLQVARGIAYLHSRMCVHRDLAARNVLVGVPSEHGGGVYRCGHVLKLADLGLSRVLRAEEDYYRQRSDDAVPIKWQCPVSIKTRTYTVKSDVYSFGVLLWEVLALGASPYPKLSAMEALRAASNGERLPQPHPDAPEAALGLLRTCMGLDVPARPPMADVVRRLEAQLAALMKDPDHGGAFSEDESVL